MHLGNEERLHGVNQSTLCLLICHLSCRLFEVVISCACELKESFLSAHYVSQWGYHVRSAEDPAALEQHFESLFYVCFDFQLNYYTKPTYTQVSNKYWNTSKWTKQVHSQFKDSSCICLLCLEFRLNIFFWLLWFFFQLPMWRLRNLYLHRSILLLCNVSGSGTSIAHSGFLNSISHVYTLKIDLSVNRTVGQRHSFPYWTSMDISTCMGCI